MENTFTYSVNQPTRVQTAGHDVVTLHVLWPMSLSLLVYQHKSNDQLTSQMDLNSTLNWIKQQWKRIWGKISCRSPQILKLSFSDNPGCACVWLFCV